MTAEASSKALTCVEEGEKTDDESDPGAVSHCPSPDVKDALQATVHALLKPVARALPNNVRTGQQGWLDGQRTSSLTLSTFPVNCKILNY